ncbi:unnamed protein product [Closterium sp. NIES-53]
MEKHRVIFVFLLLCTLASVASSKVLYKRATAILSGVNVLGGTDLNLGFGRVGISVYIDGLSYVVRTYVTVNNMFSNGNIPMFGPTATMQLGSTDTLLASATHYPQHTSS